MKGRRILPAGFLSAEGFIYAAFLLLDLLGYRSETITLKYAGLLLCLVFALRCGLASRRWTVPLALTLTAGADWFLLVLGRYYSAGLVLFLGVQLLYLLHLRQQGAPLLLPWRIGAVLALWTVLLAVRAAHPLTLLAAAYFPQLVVSAISAGSLRNQGWRSRCMWLGLSFFVCCDLCVGLFQISTGLPSRLADAVYFGMWLFYLPSQVLIALSTLPNSGGDTSPCEKQVSC